MSSKRVKEDIAASGFVAHHDKYSWEPTPKDDLLGFSLDFKEGVIHVPQQRIQRLKERTDKVICHKHTVTTREVAGVVGTVVSMGLSLGPVSRLYSCIFG